MNRFVTRRRRVAALAAALLGGSALAAPVAAADGSTRQAVDLVNRFIAEQQRRFRNGASSVLSDAATSRLYLEDALAEALSGAELGFDPVFDAQDADIANVRVSPDPEAPVLQGAIQVVATFTNFGAPQRLDYTLVQRAPGEPFQISTIYSPRNGWSLSQLVDVPRPAPGAPEVTLYDAASPAPSAAQAGGGVPAPAGDRAELLFILDGSGSMWGQIDGVPKIATAKEALKGLAADLSETVNVGLMAYGHRREGDCGDISLILPPGAHAPAAMSRAVDGVVPRGKTPIADALSQAATAFSGDRASNVLLVSDGLETCNGDPCAAAAALAARGIDTRVHVVGFDLSSEEAAALACIAREGNGLYLTASNAAELNEALVRVADEARAAPPAPAPEPEPSPAASDVVFEETFDGPLDPSWRIENEEPSLAGLVPGGELFASAVGRTVYFDAEATNRFLLDQPLPDGDFDLVLDARVSRQTGAEGLFLSLMEDADNQIAAVLYNETGGCGTAMHLAIVRVSGGERTVFERELFNGPFADDICTGGRAGANEVLDALADEGAQLVLSRRGRELRAKIEMTLPPDETGAREVASAETEPVSVLRLRGAPAILAGQYDRAGRGESHFFLDRFAVEVPR